MMSKIKVRMRFERFCLKRMAISSIISRCIEATLKAEKVDMPCEINVLVTNDEGIRAINKACRDIDKATDVLSFPMFQFTPGQLPEDWTEYLDPETDMCPLGDMAISLERAIAQAKEFGHSARREIGYLTIHSMLHLLGYDHLDEGVQKAQMREREEAIAASVPGMNRT
jgi:probable rRNA maturation factor